MNATRKWVQKLIADINAAADDFTAALEREYKERREAASVCRTTPADILRPAGWHGPVTEEQARAHPCWLVRTIDDRSRPVLDVFTTVVGEDGSLRVYDVECQSSLGAMQDACAIDPHDGRWVEVRR